MSASLHDHILTCLDSTGGDQHPWSLLILAALDGPDALTRYLTGTGTPPAPPKRARRAAAPASASAAGSADFPAPEPPGVFLGAITIAGFRGIGPDTRRPLHAGPASPWWSGATAPANRASPKAWRCCSPAPACAGTSAPRRGARAGATCTRATGVGGGRNCWGKALAGGGAANSGRPNSVGVSRATDQTGSR